MTDRAVTGVALVSGVVFVVFGLGKFVAYDSELDAFRGFGLPIPGAFVIMSGIVETLGGLLLLARRLLLPAAAILACQMTGAFIVGGVLHGDVVPSLTLAPALLVAMLFLVSRTLPGRPSAA